MATFGGHQPLTGRLGIVIYVFPPDKRVRDLDNLLKQPLDALQHAGVYLNDGQIDQLMIRRQTPVKFGYLLVMIDDGDTSNESAPGATGRPEKESHDPSGSLVQSGFGSE